MELQQCDDDKSSTQYNNKSGLEMLENHRQTENNINNKQKNLTICVTKINMVH